MKIKITKGPEVIFSSKAVVIIAISFLVYLIVNYLYLRQTAYNDIQGFLKNANNRIISDLVYANNKWDTSGYVNDDQTIQDKPLYIITSDGFIIDRIKPINGFLDTSDYKFSASFQTPQTVTSLVNEVWRLYSKSIIKDGNTLGTVIVGYYQPELAALQDIDKQLTNSADTILSQVKINGDKIDVSGVDVKKINVKASIEIIDRFNHALISIGGIPAYIDRSYIVNETTEKYKTISDSKTGEPFRIYAKPILDPSKGFIGVVVSGYSLKQTTADLKNQLIFLTISGVVVIVFILLLMTFVFQRQLAYFITKPKEILMGSSGKKNAVASQKILEVDQKMDGSVVVTFQGKGYKISKPEFDSESDQLIGRLMDLEPDAKEIDFDCMKDQEIKLTTPLSRIATRLGFKGMVRDLFFPRTSKQSVLFRRYLTQEDLINMNLTSDAIASELAKMASVKAPPGST